MAENQIRIRVNRRSFIKASAATGAALAAGPVFAPAVQAAKTIKLGYVSPQTGPLAAFAQADNFVVSNFLNTVKGGLKIGSASYPVEVVVKDSQSNPNRAAQVAKELIVSDKIDLMLVASTPETTNPVSTQCEIEEVPCISTVAPWQPFFIGRQSNPADPASWKPFNYTYHFFWGLEDVISVFTNMWGQLKTDKSVGGLFPNDGDGNAWGDTHVGFPPVLDKLGYKLTDPGRYQNLTDDFTRADHRVQEGGMRHHHRRGDTAGFHHLLEPGAAAGLQAEGGLDRQGDPVPGRGRSVGQERQQPFFRGVVDAEPPVQIVADRAVGQGHCRRIREELGQAVDAADRVRACAVRGCRRLTEALGRGPTTRRSSRRSPRPSSRRWSGTSNGDSKNLPPFAQKNIAKTPLVGGQWRLRNGNKYEIVITDNKTATEIPVGGHMEPIA